MNFTNFFQFARSLRAKRILYCLGVAVIVLLVFQAGVFVGYHKAAFSYRWGDNYYRTFGGREHFLRNFPRGGFPDAYGVAGKIINITLPTLVIDSRDNVEKIVLINNDTAIRRFRETITTADLKVGDTVVVVGSPNNQGQIEAKLIRLILVPPEPVAD